MKRIPLLLVLLLFVPHFAAAQNVSFELKAGPELTIPLGTLNQQFWHFSQDSAVTYKNIKARKTPLPGACISPGVKLVFRPEKKIQFTLGMGLDYYFKRYKIDYSATYDSVNQAGAFNANYQVSRHELGLNMLPGLAYKRLNFKVGLNLLFVVKTTTNKQFLTNENIFLSQNTHEIDELTSLVHITLPMEVSYTFPVSKTMSIAPFICYTIGIDDMDGYAINWNRREEALLSELVLGVTLCVKK